MKHILNLFPEQMKRSITETIMQRQHELEEIRIRIGQPIELVFNHHYSLMDDEIISASQLHTILMNMTGHSLYRYDEEIKQGYMTLEGGHRVGFAGHIIKENNEIHHMTHISYMNIRIAKDVHYYDPYLFTYLYEKGQWKNCCIIGAPQSGKTTFLRQLAFVISNGMDDITASKLFIVDERSEIVSLTDNGPLFNIGKRTDVLDNCPKHIGMQMGIRSMSPQVIMVDEIGSKADVLAIKEAIYAGVHVICTIHAFHVNDLMAKNDVKALVEENTFDRYVVLERQRQWIEIMIYNAQLQLLFRKRMKLF